MSGPSRPRVFRSLLVLALSMTLVSASAVATSDDHPFAIQATDLLTRLDIRAREFKRNAEALNELAFRPDASSILVHKTRLNMLHEDLAIIAELCGSFSTDAGKQSCGRCI
jgi:hypothetical protein